MALVSFVDVDPGHSANHSIGCDFPRLLKLLDRTLGFRTEDTIDRPGIVSQSFEGVLQVSYGGVIGSLLQYRFCHGVPFCWRDEPDRRGQRFTVFMNPPLERKHATHQGLPGNRTDNSVHRYGRNVERKGLLKTTHCSLRHGSEDPIDFGSLAGITR